jgi:D-3-phosphoglycerate dehydrogenase
MAELVAGKPIWLIDDEFDSHDIEHKMLEKKVYSLIVSRGSQYKTDYRKYAQHVNGILVWIGHPMESEDIKGLLSCKIISVRGGGYNNIDIDAATRQGIAVTFVPGYCVEEVSSHALSFILYFNRRIQECLNMTSEGGWWADKLTPTRRLSSQVLGLVGLGKIAKAVARKAQCLGMRVWAYDPFMDPSEMKELGIKNAEFKNLVSSADYISLHVPLTPETKHLFNKNVFDMMKPTTYLINTCRGEVVDEEALVNALEAKKIAGAGLDVLNSEPPDPQNPLLTMPNVIVSPHSAYISQESLTEVLVRSTQMVIDTLEGKIPEGIVNHSIFCQGSNEKGS